MQQLSAQDASFLYQETPGTPMHVGSVAILDPAGSPFGRPGLTSMLEFYERRLHLMPMARRRLVRLPMDADYPYWIEDANFDLEYHVREVALPEPANWRQLFILCARILSYPLDMSRPPWEAYLIHGLKHLDGVPPDAVALLTKIHHCAVDGRSGVDMSIAMSDLTPEGEQIAPPAEPWRGEPEPGPPELMARSMAGLMQRPMQAAELAAAMLGSRDRVTRLFQARPQAAATQPPPTRFNRAVSSHRSIGFERFALDEVRAMKNALQGATVNDVALTVCGGALRRYLEAKFELPDTPLVAMAPISIRKKGDTTMGNQVSAMFVPIGTHIADARQRLEAVRNATHSAKLMTEAVGADLMTRYGEFVPSALANLGHRVTAEYARTTAAVPGFNCSITNVPGPQVPLYMMGCRLVTTLGYGPIVHNMGLIVPISSYCGEFTISFTSCREMVPDPEFFLACIRDAYADLRTATLGDAADTKVAAVQRNYTAMAQAALEELRSTRQRAAAP
jgi:diacylglycerol O-acyltransferase